MNHAIRAGRGVRLTETQRRDWLRLIRSQNVGPRTFRDLLNRFGDAAAALEALPVLARRGGRRAIRVASTDDADRELEAAARADARFVALGEPDYPHALAAADSPPPLLALRGEATVLTNRAVGMVGSRNASLAGAKMTERLATGLGRAGYTVVSGLARGIDAAAHRASLSTGTIACMAGGLDCPYPPENVPLMDEIAERGAVVSEMPFGWEPRARDFPRRNRLIAGMTLGTVVIEAAKRSGSLITGRLANEMGRVVMAVPGSPLDPRAAGANDLIKRGAQLVTSTADVLEILDPMLEAPHSHVGTLLEPVEEPFHDPASPLPDERERVLLALGPTPCTVDELIAHCGSSAATVQMILLELQLAGRLDRQEGGHVALVRDDP